jgi:uncharacterized membrane protein
LVSDVSTPLKSEKGFDRLVFFSDAVVAIAISLLILPVVDEVSNTSDRSVGELLSDNAGRLLAFALSFVVIAKFWMVHHAMFDRVNGYTATILWLNMLWLAGIVWLPLPTELLGGQFAGSRLTHALYIGSMFVVSAALTLMNQAMVRTPEIHRDSVVPPERYGGVAITGMTLVALVVAVAVPPIGMFAMFLLILAGPIERRLWPSRTTRPAGPLPR